MSRECTEPEVVIESSSLVPPEEGSIQGPQFDWECPDFDVPCACPPMNTTTHLEIIGCDEMPWFNVDAVCTESSGCPTYDLVFDVGLPFGCGSSQGAQGAQCYCEDGEPGPPGP